MAARQPLLRRETERVVSDALSKMLSLVEEGMSPQAAIKEAASHADLTDHQIRMLARAYNTGVVLHQINSGKTLFEKAAAPTLVNPEQVIRELRHYKKAESNQIKYANDYDMPPDIVIDGAYKGDWSFEVRFATTDYKTKRSGMLKAAELCKSAQQEASRVRYAADYKASRAIENLRQYFCMRGAIAPDEVSENCRARFGTRAVPIIKLASANAGHTDFRRNVPVDWNAAPYKYVADAIDGIVKEATARQIAARIPNADVIEHRIKRRVEMTRPVYGSVIDELSRRSCLYDDVVKSAQFPSILPAVHARLTEAVTGGMVQPDSATTELLLDPGIRAHVAQAKVKAVLAELSNNDPIISEYSTDDIASAYNRLSDMAPRAMQNPSTIRVFLRKYLTTGTLDPFDLEQLTRIEKQISASRDKLIREALGAGTPAPKDGGD